MLTPRGTMSHLFKLVDVGMLVARCSGGA